MRYIDAVLPTPAENLAYEELLLDGVEHGELPETLRIWESPVPFVVVGTSQRIREYVNIEACERDGVGAYRRCSAGGCVLQGPGCLNFSLVLEYGDRPELRTLHASYCYILNRIGDALRTLGIEAGHQGICDLAHEGFKISGNAQKRRRRAFLHHGTLLYAADIAGMQRYLLEPSDQPEYRGGRPHAAFVRNIPREREALWHAVQAAFAPHAAPEPLTEVERGNAQALAAQKYATPEWTYRR